MLLGVIVTLAAPAHAQGLPDFTDLVEKVGPAVVNIRTTERVRAARGGSGEIDEDMLDFFRRRGIPIPQIPNRPDRARRTPKASPSSAASARASSSPATAT